MPKSKFRPDPSVVQSGYYNDRNGAPDRSIRPGGDPVKSAAAENSQSRSPGPGLAGGAPHPAVLAKALQNGGVMPQDGGAGDEREELVQGPDNWYIKKSDPFAELEHPDGTVDVELLQAHSPLQKSDDDEDEEPVEDEDERRDRQADERQVRDGVQKHVAPASEDSTHPGVYNASDDTGLDSGQEAEAWTSEEVYLEKGFGLDEMEDWIEKSARRELDPDDALAVLDDYLDAETCGFGMSKAEARERLAEEVSKMEKAAGQGAFPQAGNPPGSMPTTQRPTDGDERVFQRKAGGTPDAGATTAESTASAARSSGNLYEGRVQKFPVMSDDIEFDDFDEDLMAQAGGQALGGLGKMRKSGDFLDSRNAVEQSHRLRSLAKAVLANRDVDVEVGLGVAPEDVEVGEASSDATEFQKGLVYHSDASDLAIEKAFRRHGDGSTHFAATSVAAVDLRSPLIRGHECGTCGTLVKSFLTVCDVCGVSHVGAPSGHVGVHYDEGLQKALAPREQVDVILE